MLSDTERSDEDDSRLDDAHNGDSKMDTSSSNAKLNGGKNIDDEDESSMASTSKDAKNESKDQKKPGIKKKKKKGATDKRQNHYRTSKGYKLWHNKENSDNDIPEEYTEEEVVTQTGSGKKTLYGKVYKNTNNSEYEIYRCYTYGIEYKVGETIYIDESRGSDSPYNICLLDKISMNKRDSLTIHIKWFYRTNEVPEQTYHSLTQDRKGQYKQICKILALAEREAATTNNGTDGVNGEDFKTKLKLARLMVTRKWTKMLKTRELFVSEVSESYPVSVLRGKCTVMHCQDNVDDVSKFVPNDDTFFYFLSYNPENRRLAQRGEICIGATHQANPPECTPDVPIEERSDGEHHEEMSWEPGRIHDHDLLMYLRAGRSMAAFAAMCDGETPEEGFVVATRDGIGLNAIQLLHDSGYDTGKALQSLIKTPFPEYGGADPSRKWPEEDMKEFIKGLKLYGKNFFKIRQEFLPHRDTPELVEFYYLWKKTPGAAANRPRGRRPRPGKLGRLKNGKSTSKNNRDEDPDYLSSCSDSNELDEANDNTGTKNGDSASSPPAPSNYYCRHCYTLESKDWHHAGKDNILSCHECRLYFKKYGEFPCLDPNQPGDDDISESSEEEPEIEIKPPTDKKLDLNAIEQDSSEDNHFLNGNENSNNDATSHEPVEIKGEPVPKSVGLVSPVPTMPAHHVPSSSQNTSSPSSSQGLQIPSNQHSLAPPTSGSGNPNNHVAPPPAHSNQHNNSNDIQILSSKQPQQLQHQQQQPPQPPMPPREPSPPPKPDGSECHRSQSAIFTRQWNRGEGNSCSRTDLYFKPVPDSKLARKREERLRKANEKEDQLRAAQQAQEQAAKVARMEQINPYDPFSRRTPSAVPPQMGIPPQLGSPYGPLAGEIERHERERERERLMAAAAGGSPRTPFAPPNAPGTPGPPPGGNPFLPPMHGHDQRGRQLEELMRASANAAEAERVYNHRLQVAALAQDPLVRLQMAGVNPEIPGAFHPSAAAYANLLAGGRPPPGFDPRFRTPGPADLLRPPMGPGYPPRGPGPAIPPDLMQRHLMLEQENRMRTASAQQIMAQQEAFLQDAIRHQQQQQQRPPP